MPLHAAALGLAIPDNLLFQERVSKKYLTERSTTRYPTTIRRVGIW